MTKQFTILFILVTVFIFAMSTVAALAYRESTTTYDTSGIQDGLEHIAYQAAHKISDQELYMQGWVDEATNEVHAAAYANFDACFLAWNAINP